MTLTLIVAGLHKRHLPPWGVHLSSTTALVHPALNVGTLKQVRTRGRRPFYESLEEVDSS